MTLKSQQIFSRIVLCIVLFLLAECTSEDLVKKYSMKLIHRVADVPRKIFVNEREKTIFLACEINANTNIVWFHNDKEIVHPPPYILDWKRKSKTARGSVLMIRRLRGKYWDGKYDCVADTPNGKVKATVNISIEKASELPPGFPHIKIHPGNVHTKRESVDFHCCVSGKPPFRFNWYYNRNPIQTDEIYEVSPNVKMQNAKGDVKYCSNLRVKDASKPTGFFQCVVMNDIGQVVSKEAKIAFNIKKSNGFFLRKRRNLQILCPASAQNITQDASDPVKRNHIERTCLYNDGMIISWQPPKNKEKLKYYVLNVMKTSGEQIMCFKINKETTYFNFDATKGFRKAMDYQVVVDTYPSKFENLKTKQLKGCYGNKVAHPSSNDSINGDSARKERPLFIHAFIGVCSVLLLASVVLLMVRNRKVLRSKYQVEAVLIPENQSTRCKM